MHGKKIFVVLYYMTFTWTTGYDICEAYPFVEGGLKQSLPMRTPAGTVTFDRESICGMLDPFLNYYDRIVT
jgi:hypothetical protein